MQDQRLELLRPKMDTLFAKAKALEAKGRDINKEIQKGKEYRNPRIGEKLIEMLNIDQYGSNFKKDKYHLDTFHNSGRHN